MKTSDVQKAAGLLETREQISILRLHMEDGGLCKLFLKAARKDEDFTCAGVSLDVEAGIFLLDKLDRTIGDELRDLGVEYEGESDDG